MDHQPQTWVALGRVGRPHGLKGAFFIVGFDPGFGFSFREVRIGETPLEAECYKVRSCKASGDQAILSCSSLSRREHAEPLRGKLVFAHRQHLHLDSAEEYLWSDLIGKRIASCDGQSLVGTITAVRNFGASDLIAISLEDGAQVEAPFIRDFFDMSFRPEDPTIRLAVPQETLEPFRSTVGKP